jgi:hypothetical protein
MARKELGSEKKTWCVIRSYTEILVRPKTLVGVTVNC